MESAEANLMTITDNAETVLTDDSKSRWQRRGSDVWEQWYDICAPSDVSSSIIIIIILL